MARVTVGGKTREISKEEVIGKMRGVQAEPIREHIVEIGGTAFPPKQALEVVTAWDRRGFTSLEAVRVLTRVGFVCRRASQISDLQLSEGPGRPGEHAAALEQRVSQVESALAVAQEAIARLANRVTTLEAAIR
jgi:hypothetical protein